MQRALLFVGNLKKKFFCSLEKFNSRSICLSSKLRNINYCIDLVRTLDHDNFLSSLLLPPNLRPTAFAIRALNVELSKVQDHAKEQQLGVTRFKFWEDGLESIYKNNPLEHPVLSEVNKAVKRHTLSKLLFKRLVSAREKQLNVSTFKDMKDMENYADHTCSSVLMLLLEALNVRNIDCDHVASHVGTAQGLTNLIRSLPFNLKENIVLLPRTELLKHKISEESLIRNSVDPSALSDVIFNIASKANAHLKVAESLKHKIPRKCRTVFLPAVPVRLFLQDLEKAKFHIYDPKLRTKSGSLPYILLWNHLRKSF